jgi:segregation and condensation protein B
MDEMKGPVAQGTPEVQDQAPGGAEDAAARPAERDDAAVEGGDAAGGGATENDASASVDTALESATVDSVLGTVRDENASVPSGSEPAPKAVDEQLKAIIEALVFASPDPLTPKLLFKLLEHEPREDVEAALESLKRDYDGQGGLQLVEVAGGYQIVTRPELHEWVRRLFHERKTTKLSVQALETLAVIAYRQPITGPEIAEIRAVNTSGVLNTLLERHLIKIAGRKQVIGRPFLYATTREFLIRFGLNNLGDLPKMEDVADLLGLDAPLGLAETGPSPGTLPLELEPEPAAVDDEPLPPEPETIN